MNSQEEAYEKKQNIFLLKFLPTGAVCHGDISYFVPKMENAVKRKHMSKHRKNPRNCIQIWNEPDSVEMIEQPGVVKGLQVSKFGQVLLNYRSIVFSKHSVQVSK